MGHNVIETTVKRICAVARIGGKKTNHSLRSTAATRLYEANISEQQICEHTGHRSDAVRLYKRTTDQQKAMASDILACKAPKIENPKKISLRQCLFPLLTQSQAQQKVLLVEMSQFY
ncbi:uncharacterized protein LOC124282196 [Haliotis rubra]|uniref:uncharacterized protein LOC124282196 n=1 Tax=Haliotis rubra TaxID=36100 RepID=UPI001EE50824|nr:uncharacterized protein LOC124282196 [Haliotis rubra]